MSRRGALLALGGAAAGGVGLALASSIMGAEPAAATQGDAVLAGETNTATATTEVTTTSGYGLYGNSSASDGIHGVTSNDGSSGVFGSAFGRPPCPMAASHRG